MVHYVFWLFSGGAPASRQPGGGGLPKPPSHLAAARRISYGIPLSGLLLVLVNALLCLIMKTVSPSCHLTLHDADLGVCEQGSSFVGLAYLMDVV